MSATGISEYSDTTLPMMNRTGADISASRISRAIRSNRDTRRVYCAVVACATAITGVASDRPSVISPMAIWPILATPI